MCSVSAKVSQMLFEMSEEFNRFRGQASFHLFNEIFRCYQILRLFQSLRNLVLFCVNLQIVYSISSGILFVFYLYVTHFFSVFIVTSWDAILQLPQFSLRFNSLRNSASRAQYSLQLPIWMSFAGNSLLQKPCAVSRINV